MSALETFVARYGRQKYLVLSLAFYLLADAVLPQNRVLTWSVLALLILAGPLATDGRGFSFRLTVGLAVGMVLLGFTDTWLDSGWTAVAASGVGAAFFATLIFVISRSLLIEQKVVTGDTLWAAVNVYVLFGLHFAFLYAIVLELVPGAFTGGILDAPGQESRHSLIYYSFVTMTTLGYGDITPKVHVAATLAYVQALVGQLYVAILIARLVALYGTGSRPADDGRAEK